MVQSGKSVALFIEALLYIALGARIFGNQIGVLNVTGLSGGVIVVAGIACLTVMAIRREPVAISIYFATLISILATIVDLYYVDLVPRNMLFWTSVMLMMCYVVRDADAHLRCAFFLAASVFVSVLVGGTFFSATEGLQRLGLEPGSVATMFGNPNDLAQISLITALALLFLSFDRSTATKVASFSAAAGLAYIVLLTLSRQGLLLILLGLAAYGLLVAKSLANRWLEGALFVSAALVVAIIFNEELSRIIDGYLLRFTLDSGRVDYWKTAPQDMYATLMSGYGTFSAYSSEGIQPHSAFLWLHLAYGGFCAAVYAAWLLWLGSRTAAIVLSRNLPPHTRVESLTLFSVFFALQFTGVFTPYNYGCILAVATLEKNFLLEAATNA